MTRWKRWVVVDAILIALSIANGWYWPAGVWLAAIGVELICVRRGIP
jgi:hypothetical protein